MDDSDLSDAQLVELTAKLHALRDELTALLADDRTATVELDQAAVGRISRVDALQQQAMAEAERRRHELRMKQVGTALKRVELETYGDCVRCGEPIGYRRLLARPETPFCVGCA